MKWTNSYRSFGLKTKRSTGLKTIEHKQPFRPVGAVRPVLVGREPQAAPQLAAHGGLVPADPLRGPTDAQMLFAMQLLDQDPLLGRQVRILLTHECNTFLS